MGKHDLPTREIRESYSRRASLYGNGYRIRTYKNTDTGEWEPSSETIDLVAGGAVAQHGQHKVIFASDLATFGAIDLETPDGQQLQSHLLGLSYFDRASGQSVFIAEVTNSIGQLISSNQVWYDNAFTGLKARSSLHGTRGEVSSRTSFWKNSRLPRKRMDWILGPRYLQAFTEFISPPAPEDID